MLSWNNTHPNSENFQNFYKRVEKEWYVKYYVK